MNNFELSDLFKKDHYLNKNIDLLTNKIIIEYDIKSANVSLCKEYGLLPDSKIEKISEMKKQDRVVKIGKMMRKDPLFKENLKNAFIDIRRRFILMNQIQDEQILTIKRDALFILRECYVTDFGACHFIKKNVYSSYMYLNNMEIYYLSGGFNPLNSKIDVKGIDNEILKKHDNYMNKFFITLFKYMETGSRKDLFRYLRKFIDKYKRRELDIGFYREFNNESYIRMIDDQLYDDSIFIPYENKQDHVCIDYNFFNLLLPIVTRLI